MELLIRVVDKVNPDDANLNKQLTKRGDVIAIMPDGHNWGTKELSNPDWRIVRMPSLTRLEAESLLEGEDPEKVAFPAKRKNKLNVDDALLTKEVKDHISDDTRRTRIIEADDLKSRIEAKELTVFVELEP